MPDLYQVQKAKKIRYINCDDNNGKSMLMNLARTSREPATQQKEMIQKTKMPLKDQDDRRK